MYRIVKFNMQGMLVVVLNIARNREDNNDLVYFIWKFDLKMHHYIGKCVIGLYLSFLFFILWLDISLLQENKQTNKPNQTRQNKSKK